VAIVGGSGSGKTYLARRLQQSLGENAIHLALDDFYLDRSHLTPGRRARLNFDHPRAIDWPLFEKVLRALRRGRGAMVPEYDFATHSRRGARRRLEPCQVVLVDGLWLLRRPSVRRLFSLAVFLDCPAEVRLSRRLERDMASRGRTRKSVIEQFRSTVEPMHRAYVEPQRRYAHIILQPESAVEKTLMLLNMLA
jgi:uridine kinase